MLKKFWIDLYRFNMIQEKEQIFNTFFYKYNGFYNKYRALQNKPSMQS